MSRWETYSEARSKTMEKIESKLTLKDFRSSLPAAISKDKEYCTKVHKLLVRDLISKVSEFSDEVEDQVKLKTYLDQLDEMVKNTDTTTGSTAWRPSRNPLDNQAPRDRPIMLSGQEKLKQSTVGKLDESVTSLENRVKELSDEIADNAIKIDRLTEKIEAAD